MKLNNNTETIETLRSKISNAIELTPEGEDVLITESALEEISSILSNVDKMAEIICNMYNPLEMLGSSKINEKLFNYCQKITTYPYRV